jgi:quercetin dioxygenase-like cupin family protein
MGDFPPFVKHPKNRVAAESQYTPAVEGYVFDGADGSQVVLWSCHQDRVSREHIHDFDEYLLVIEGRVTVIADGESKQLGPGQEIVVPRGVRQRTAVVAGTRTMHVFSGRRAGREGEPEE